MKILGIVFCLTIIAAAIFANFSVNNTFITDDSTYDIIRQAENGGDKDNLIDKKIDDKSHFLIRPFLFLGYEDAILIITLACLSITLAFLFLAVKKKYLVLFVVGCAPLFIKAFISYTDYTILLPLCSIMLYLLVKKKLFYSLIPYILISYISFYTGLFILILLLFYFFKNKIKWYVPACYILSISFFTDFSIRNNFFFRINFLERIFVGFGVSHGISIPIFLVCLIAFYSLRKDIGLILLSILTFIGISLLDLNASLFVANFVSVYLASGVLNNMMKWKWDIKIMKNITILLILFSMLFSNVSYASNIIKTQDINEAIIDGMVWLRNNSKPGEIVLSHYSLGQKIKFFSKRQVILDNDLSLIKNSRTKFNDVNQIFESRNINTTTALLDKYRISYIFITKKMEKGLTWNKPDDGLLFIIGNNQEFKVVFRNEMVRIVKYERI